MCGRFSLTTELHKLEERFFLENIDSLEYSVTYNVAPGQHVLAVVPGKSKNRPGYLKWGLVPNWAKDPRIGYKMINARSETLREKVSFNKLLERRRCLILADGFYEWKTINGEKRPMRFVMKDEEPFAFAGLWDRWEQNVEEIVSCTVVTTEPNRLVKDVHNRMPVILKKEMEEVWLNPEEHDSGFLTSILEPFDADLMSSYYVSTDVNTPKNNSPSCITPI